MRALVLAVAGWMLAGPAWAAGMADCQQEKNPDLAIKSCTAIVKNTKETAANRALAYFYRGVANAAKRKYDDAIADYTAAVKLNPADAQSYNNRGNLYDRKGDNGRALADYSKAIQANPQYGLAYSNRCWSYYLAGDFAHALADCNQALSLNPKNSHALDSRCAAYIGLKKYDQAIKDCGQAIALDPNYGYPYFHRGDALYRKGQPKPALADFQMAQRLIPKGNAEYQAKVQSRISDIQAGKPAPSSP
ncbi:MAG TPA: tetratricopeptide repeat protein [Candidatus Acidoferrum sp.]|nr:tetratricopeptide repeat protein [Candidatus Acidoferrum sp.]